MAQASRKDDRLHVRLPSTLRARIDQAAAAEGKTVTDFALDALVTRADHVLADCRLFALDDEGWDAFVRLLDQPAQVRPRLAELLSRKPPEE